MFYIQDTLNITYCDLFLQWTLVAPLGMVYYRRNVIGRVRQRKSNSSKPWVKFKNFSDYVSNIDQKGDEMGVDKRRFLLKTSSFLFPYAVFMIMGFRAFFFLYFIKYRIYSHNSPHPPLLDISWQRRVGEGSHEPLGAGSPPPWQISVL